MVIFKVLGYIVLLSKYVTDDQSVTVLDQVYDEWYADVIEEVMGTCPCVNELCHTSAPSVTVQFSTFLHSEVYFIYT